MKIKGILFDYIFILIGTTMLAISISVFYEPNGMVTGGVSGLAIMIANLSRNLIGFEIPISLTNIVLNLPLLIIGYYVLGRNFVGKTIIATIYLSVALILTDMIPPFEGDLILISVFGGVIAGIGLGLVFSRFATTGGSDLAASIINKSLPHISVSKLLLAIDAAVILLGLLVFGVEKALYAIVAVFISSKAIDYVLEGMAFSKAAFIISSEYTKIAEEIMLKVERGVTSLSGKGMYTHDNIDVLLCVVSQKQIIAVKEVAKRIDPNAFVIVADVREVLGNGFE